MSSEKKEEKRNKTKGRKKEQERKRKIDSIVKRYLCARLVLSHLQRRRTLGFPLS